MSNRINIANEGGSEYLVDPNKISLIIARPEKSDFFDSIRGYIGAINEAAEDDFGPKWLSALENSGLELWSFAIDNLTGVKKGDLTFLRAHFKLDGNSRVYLNTDHVILAVQSTDLSKEAAEEREFWKDPNQQLDTLNCLQLIIGDHQNFSITDMPESWLRKFESLIACSNNIIRVRLLSDKEMKVLFFDPARVRQMSVMGKIVQITIKGNKVFFPFCFSMKSSSAASDLAKDISEKIPDLALLKGTKNPTFVDPRGIHSIVVPDDLPRAWINFDYGHRTEKGVAGPFVHEVQFAAHENLKNFLEIYAHHCAIHSPSAPL